jgi:hypothetical protein
MTTLWCGNRLAGEKRQSTTPTAFATEQAVVPALVPVSREKSSHRITGETPFNGASERRQASALARRDGWRQTTRRHPARFADDSEKWFSWRCRKWTNA